MSFKGNVLFLFFSFLVKGAGHCPSLFKKVPEASWMCCKNTNRCL